MWRDVKAPLEQYSSLLIVTITTLYFWEFPLAQSVAEFVMRGLNCSREIRKAHFST